MPSDSRCDRTKRGKKGVNEGEQEIFIVIKALVGFRLSVCCRFSPTSLRKIFHGSVGYR